MLAALLCKRAKLHEELRSIEKQVISFVFFSISCAPVFVVDVDDLCHDFSWRSRVWIGMTRIVVFFFFHVLELYYWVSLFRGNAGTLLVFGNSSS